MNKLNLLVFLIGLNVVLVASYPIDIGEELKQVRIILPHIYLYGAYN